MSLAELVITSVILEGRCKSEVARDYKISRYWVHQLVRRYELEGRRRCGRGLDGRTAIRGGGLGYRGSDRSAA